MLEPVAKFEIGDTVMLKDTQIGEGKKYVISKKGYDLFTGYEYKLISQRGRTKHTIADSWWAEDGLIEEEEPSIIASINRSPSAISISANKITISTGITHDDAIDSVSCLTTKINNKKEIKEMEILNVYKRKKKDEIYERYDKLMDEVYDKDEIIIVIKEMKNQIKTIIENDGYDTDILDINLSSNYDLFTKQTKENINKLYQQRNKEMSDLNEKIEEIKAMFEMTEDYEERMKILKNYEIVDKNGKLKV